MNQLIPTAHTAKPLYLKLQEELLGVPNVARRCGLEKEEL